MKALLWIALSLAAVVLPYTGAWMAGDSVAHLWLLYVLQAVEVACITAAGAIGLKRFALDGTIRSSEREEAIGRWLKRDLPEPRQPPIRPWLDAVAGDLRDDERKLIAAYVTGPMTTEAFLGVMENPASRSLDDETEKIIARKPRRIQDIPGAKYDASMREWTIPVDGSRGRSYMAAPAEPGPRWWAAYDHVCSKERTL